MHHGKTGDNKCSKEYRAWTNMKQRCCNPGHKNYPTYGGRGIKVHPPWKKSFSAFLAWVGDAPSKKHSLGRKDNDLGYFPGNVRWETSKQQYRNMRTNVFYRGKCLRDWSVKFGINYSTIHRRWMKGLRGKMLFRSTDGMVKGTNKMNPLRKPSRSPSHE